MSDIKPDSLKCPKLWLLKIINLMAGMRTYLKFPLTLSLDNPLQNDNLLIPHRQSIKNNKPVPDQT